MSKFQTGDRVRHNSRGEDGTVTMLANGNVLVTFDKLTPRGTVSQGEYDDVWFNVYPNGLSLVPNGDRA